MSDMSLHAALHKLKGGQSAVVQANGHEFKVSYSSEPSRGDNGKLVSGATVGHYSVEHPGGRYTTHEHGPHANTEGAAKRGANPNAKTYGVEQAVSSIMQTARTANVFNDRRR